jgi:ATP-dependent Clp protease ATP-binding subunit ClpA
MFERYTEIARRVIVSSKHKAGHVGSPNIDTEHLLLGLLSTDKGLARRFLGSPWAAEAVWGKIEQSRPIHKPIQAPFDLPLSSVSKRALSYGAEEADRLSCKHIGTELLLLGLLREENCFAAEFLHEHGVHLAPTREELIRIPHNYSATEEFVRKRGPLPKDVVELQTQIGVIFRRVEDAVAQRDFAKAREYSQEESKLREKLRLLYQHHGLPDWLYETAM